MSQPKNHDEYLARFYLNRKVSGFGPLSVTVSCPCPFCSAADFMIFAVIDTEEAMAEGATCKECGRGAKAVLSSPAGGGKQFEIVQTSGDDQPEWLKPKMRRIS